jgi:hypothetical protein
VNETVDPLAAWVTKQDGDPVFMVVAESSDSLVGPEFGHFASLNETATS